METQLTASLPKLFIGLDIHKRSWSVHMRTDISEHKSMTIPAREETLINYVESYFPAHQVAITYEAGCCGFHAARCFLNCGWEVTVVNPADVPTMDKQHHQKTDKVDCRNLSKQLKADQLRGIYIPDTEQDLLKSLLRHKAQLSKQLRTLKNQIKALLLYHGVTLPAQFDTPAWSKAFKAWLCEVQWNTVVGQKCMDSKLRVLDLYETEVRTITNELRAYCRKNYKKDYYLLRSIPGIGGFLAAAILAEVGDLRRFRTEGEFASYIGIIPSMYNSGNTERSNGVTPRCRALLRTYIIESAWVALRKDPDLQTYYRKHLGKNPKRIIVKIARKLLNRMLAVIKTETAYEIKPA